MFIVISGRYTKSNRYAVRVHEQPHFYDGKRAVFFAYAILVVVFGLFDFKIKEGCSINLLESSKLLLLDEG